MAVKLVLKVLNLCLEQAYHLVFLRRLRHFLAFFRLASLASRCFFVLRDPPNDPRSAAADFLLLMPYPYCQTALASRGTSRPVFMRSFPSIHRSAQVSECLLAEDWVSLRLVVSEYGHPLGPAHAPAFAVAVVWWPGGYPPHGHPLIARSNSHRSNRIATAGSLHCVTVFSVPAIIISGGLW